MAGHVPAAVAKFHLQSTGRLPATNGLKLAIGLPLHHQAELDELIRQLDNPASRIFHRFLTPEEFTSRFGPTEADYAAVVNFARTNGLVVTGTYGNRLLLDVAGPAAAVENAFHITLRKYRHPTENRDFFAPDTEPSVDAALPVADVQGLNDYSRPHPKLYRADLAGTSSKDATPSAGSGPIVNGTATYIGNDFRDAYVPDSALNGSGQMVGLFELDGFYSDDVAAYAAAAGGGRTNIVIQTVLTNGVSGSPGYSGIANANIEVSLDIEMAMAMAPGLARIVVFEGSQPNSVLNSMLAFGNTVKNLSCSWGWGGGPTSTTDSIFEGMQAEGQTFFNASGDSDAFPAGTADTEAPSSSPYVSQIGATTLTMNGTGASYASETVWNWGYVSSASAYIGSSGGVSSYYPIPVWQQGVNSFLNNGGSTTMRNIPDMAMVGDNVYVKYGSGSGTMVGGTSCAAPLWAGFMALVNQQAAAGSQTGGMGFINPAVYEIANESIYNATFNDVTTGDDTWPSSPNAFYAVHGYDLCTGLGTPAGAALINALVNPDPLIVVSNVGFNAVGSFGGTFNIASQTFYVTNAGVSSLTWSLVNTSSWLIVSGGGGVLSAGAGISVTASLNALAADNLAPGVYTANLAFSNAISGVAHYRIFTLTVKDALAIVPTNNISIVGPAGGPFNPATQIITLTNTGSSVLNWGINNTSSWFNVTPSSGSLASGGQAPVTIAPAPGITSLPDGIYNVALQVTNLTSHFLQTVSVRIIVSDSLVQNGDFETGDFTDWTLNASDGGYPYNFVADASTGFGIVPHLGTYFAALGEVGTPLAYISQTLPTSAGQKYLLSLWLYNPVAGNSRRAPNEFSVSWNGGTLYDQKNMAQTSWMNLQFVVSATGGGTVLQIGGRDDASYLGLDDVSVIPVFPPSISQQPTNQTILSGSNVAFTVTAGGSSPLVYQWRKNGANISNGGNVSGATSNVLILAAATTNYNGNYSVVITNGYGSITSTVAALTVNLQQPVIALASSANPDGFKDSLNFIATLTPASATGSVYFLTNGVFFDGEPLVSGVAASVFTAALPRGTNQITAVYAGDAGNLPAIKSLVQAVTNHPPVALNYFTKRFAGLRLEIPVANLSSNWTDADGDPVSLAAIGVSTNGVIVTNNAGTLDYWNTNDVNDKFVCAITDGWGGTNFQSVYLAVLPLPNDALPSINNLVISGGKTISLNLAGASGFTYILEASTNLALPEGWQPVATNVVGTNGIWQFSGDITNIPQQFYRLELTQ